MLRKHWRLLVIALLLAAPLLFLAGYGAYMLFWLSGWGCWAGWVMAILFSAGYVLAWRWQLKNRLIGRVEFDVPAHWTDRDKQAWQLVEARAKAGARVEADRLSSVQFYVDTAQG